MGREEEEEEAPCGLGGISLSRGSSRRGLVRYSYWVMEEMSAEGERPSKYVFFGKNDSHPTALLA